MTPSSDYVEYVLEMLEPVGRIRTSRFFGGVAIYNDVVQFAMIMDSSLYFVVDKDTRHKYQQAGMQPFSYLTKKGLIQVHKYFELPEDVLTDPEQLQQWATESMRIAEQTKPNKKSY